jgi:hypothetical protein
MLDLSIIDLRNISRALAKLDDNYTTLVCDSRDLDVRAAYVRKREEIRVACRKVATELQRRTGTDGV